MTMRSVVLAIALAATQPVFAEPIVWSVNYGSGQIDRLSPRTGALLGSFPVSCAPSAPWPCILPDPDSRAGLTIASGGRTLLYQASTAPDPFGLRPTMLFSLDPYTGVVLAPPIETNIGPEGLSSSNQNHVFWVHGVGQDSDIHRVTDPFGASVDEAFWGPWSPSSFTSGGGLGGDSTRRQFGLYEAAADGFVPCPAGFTAVGLFIAEFDAFTDSDQFLNCFAAPTADTVGLAFARNTLYASTLSGGLFTLDPQNGAVLRHVTLPAGAPYKSDIAAVPEPPLTVLFTVAAVILTRRRQRNARELTVQKSPRST